MTNLLVDVLVKDMGWTEILEAPEDFCMNVIEKITAHRHFPPQGELSIALINDAEMQILNKNFRGKDKPTNVLSFPSIGPEMLGDIVIARETILRESAAEGLSICDHLSHMLVHGFLHLQGYDHIIESDALIMEALEIEILQAMNINNPYKMNEPYFHDR